MALNDPLSNMLSNVLNSERRGKRECSIKPMSILIKSCLSIMRDNGYVGSYAEVEDGRGNSLNLQLIGTINKCGSIKPRFSVTKDTFEKFEKRFLPAKDVGILVLTTSQGIMTHYDAKKKGIGGKLLLYCY